MEKMSKEYKDKIGKRVNELDSAIADEQDIISENSKKISRMQDIQKEYDDMRDSSR